MFLINELSILNWMQQDTKMYLLNYRYLMRVPNIFVKKIGKINQLWPLTVVTD